MRSIVTAVLLLALAPVTRAQTEGTPQTPSVKVTRGAGGQKVYRITEGIVIEGKIQKPEAFYVLQRSTINYDWEALKQDFIPKILESVKHSPF
jgi:hypothetical protein